MVIPRADVSVDVGTVLSDVSISPLGINADYWWDDQQNRSLGAKTLSQAFKDMGLKYARYPGGAKSDSYLWSVTPYDKSNPKLSFHSLSAFPSNSTTLWVPKADPDGNWVNPVVDFDEFVTECQQAGVEPNIVVPYNSVYWNRVGAVKIFTLEEAIENARQWVRYARNKGYDINYWSIGNET